MMTMIRTRSFYISCKHIIFFKEWHTNTVYPEIFEWLYLWKPWTFELQWQITVSLLHYSKYHFKISNIWNFFYSKITIYMVVCFLIEEKLHNIHFIVTHNTHVQTHAHTHIHTCIHSHTHTHHTRTHTHTHNMYRHTDAIYLTDCG